MIANISHEHRFVFLAIPRTGSRVTYQRLSTLYGCAPGGDNGGMSHSMVIPDGCKDYLAIATCRNPFERWVSYWALVKQWGPREDEPLRSIIQHVCSYPNDFVGYTRLAAGSHICQSAASQIDMAKTDNLRVLRFEQLQEMFNALPFLDCSKDNQLRLVHRPETAVWQSWYNRETEALVRAALADDFERFNYRTSVRDYEN